MSKLNKFEDVTFSASRCDYEAEYRLFTRSDFDLDRDIFKNGGKRKPRGQDRFMVFRPVRDALLPGARRFF